MSCIIIESVPELEFAHSLRTTDCYQNNLQAVKGYFEISYVAAGSIKLINNGKKYHANAGDFICNSKCFDTMVYASGMYEHHTVCFKCRFSQWTLPLVLCGTSNASYCHSLINNIIRMHMLYPDQVYSTAGLFLQLVDELGKLQESTSSLSNSPYIEQAKGYIYEHIHEPIRQADIAASLGITPEYLCSIFKQSEGTSLIPYINRIKLENMRTLIENKELTLQQAANLYGYSDPNYVSRLYKKMFGENITATLRTDK